MKAVGNLLIGALAVLSGSAIAEEFSGDNMVRQTIVKMGKGITVGKINEGKMREHWEHTWSVPQSKEIVEYVDKKSTYVYLPHPVELKTVRVPSVTTVTKWVARPEVSVRPTTRGSRRHRGRTSK